MAEFELVDAAILASVRSADIPVSEAIEILMDAELVIATLGMTKEEVVAAPAVEGEEPAEPEVIGKGKKEEEGEGEGE